MDITPNYKDVADLAEARAVAAHVAAELNVVLAVWQSQMPAGAVKALTTLQASLAYVAKEA